MPRCFGKGKSCNNKSEKQRVVVVVPEPEGEHLDGVSFVVVVPGKGVVVVLLVDDVFLVEVLDEIVVDFAVGVVGSQVLLILLIRLVEADDGGVERVGEPCAWRGSNLEYVVGPGSSLK